MRFLLTFLLMVLLPSMSVAQVRRGTPPGLRANTIGYTFTRRVASITTIPTIAPIQLGPELLTNGTFDDASSWVLSGSASIANGVSTIPSEGSIEQNLTDVRNGFYRITGTRTNLQNPLTVLFYNGSVFSSEIPAGSGPFSLDIVTQSTATSLKISRSGENSGSIDNLSLKKITFGADITYPELVQNGAFTGKSPWTDDPGYVDVANGKATWSGNDYGPLSQILPTNLIAGKVYRLKVDRGNTVNPVKFSIQTGANTLVQVPAGSGMFTTIFTANSTTNRIAFVNSQIGETGSIDNVSIHEVPNGAVSNLLTNGTFDSADGWTLVDTASIDNGVLSLPAGRGISPKATRNLNTSIAAGSFVRISANTSKTGTGQFVIRLVDPNSSSNIYYFNYTNDNFVELVVGFNTNTIEITRGGGAVSGIDDIAVEVLQ